MAKFVSGINGPYVGKVGNTIGSSWRGIPYIKSRGIRTKPATEGERLNRFIFGKTQKWLYPLTDFLRIGFKNYTHTNQGVNAAKSYLYKHALIKNGYNSIIDPSLMKVSHGSLPLPSRIDVELIDEDLVFTWDTNVESGEQGYEQIILLAYDIEEEDASISLNGQFRHTGRDVLEVKSLKNFVVYAAFISADRNSQSDSVYLGSFTRIEKKDFEVENTVGVKAQDKNKNFTVTSSNDTKKTTGQTNEDVKPVTAQSATTISVVENLNEAEYIPKNQLNLFDFLDEITINKTDTNQQSGENDLANDLAFSETQDPGHSTAISDSAEDLVDLSTENLALIENEAAVIQERNTGNPPANEESKRLDPIDNPDLVKINTVDNKSITVDNQSISSENPPDALPKKEDRKTVNQKFTYINPNITVEKGGTDVPKKPKETIVIKKKGITYFKLKQIEDENGKSG